jgi:hypothetical protein
MTDQERAVAAARDEGRQEATRAAGLSVAAATFRELATNRLTDPGALVARDGDRPAVLDLSGYVADDGTVDRAALGRLVERLAKQVGAGKVPAGPRPEPNGAGDWLGQQMRQGQS